MSAICRMEQMELDVAKQKKKTENQNLREDGEIPTGPVRNNIRINAVNKWWPNRKRVSRMIYFHLLWIVAGDV